MHKLISLLCLCSLPCLHGCFNNGEESTEAFIQRIKQQHNNNIEAIPGLESLKMHTYTAFNYKSPFEPSVGMRESNTSNLKRPDNGRPKEVLEDIPLGNLRMVGSINVGDERYALIMDKANVLHRVKVGNYIGQNAGKITVIEAKRIQILETILDAKGNWVERETNINMKK